MSSIKLTCFGELLLMLFTALAACLGCFSELMFLQFGASSALCWTNTEVFQPGTTHEHGCAVMLILHILV